MTQLALGIDPEPLSMAPFIIAVALAAAGHARADFGVTCTGGPRPRSSRRSAPTSAATSWPACSRPGSTRDRRIRLFIDVGTNSEIALGSAERVVATAAPAGPAFEAASIRCGMRAAEGAIESVTIGDDALDAGRDRRRRRRRACAARASSTPSRSWCGSG